MINMPDLVVTEILKQSLKDLAKRPDHLEYVLCGFKSIHPIRELVGPDYVKQAIDFISNNEIHVAPYYEYDQERRHSIAVVSAGSEETKFIGDSYGQGCPVLFDCPPTVYASWSAKTIDYEKVTMLVPKSYQLSQKLWNNVIITNGKDYLRLDGIIPKGEDEELNFKAESKITDNAPLVGWRAESGVKGKGYDLGRSIDSTQINITITTQGDASLHRIIQILVRYILKSRRRYFELYGLQDMTFGYTQVALVGREERFSVFESTVNVSARSTDTWIVAEYDLNTGSKIDICLNIETASEDPAKEPVELDI